MTGWEPMDVEHYNMISALGVLDGLRDGAVSIDGFWSPEEELTCKKGKAARRVLKRARLEHNDRLIKRARAMVRA